MTRGLSLTVPAEPYPFEFFPGGCALLATVTVRPAARIAEAHGEGLPAEA